MTPDPRHAGTPDYRTSLTRVTFLPRLTALVFGGGFPTPFGSLPRLPGQCASDCGHGSPERSHGGLHRRFPWDAWSCRPGFPPTKRRPLRVPSGGGRPPASLTPRPNGEAPRITVHRCCGLHGYRLDFRPPISGCNLRLTLSLLYLLRSSRI